MTDDLLRLADEESITVEYCHLPLNGSISFPDTCGDHVLMDYSLFNAGSSERVHLAHEMGHSVCGAFYSPYAARDVRQKHENHANKWAIRQLIPRSALDEAVANGYTDIYSLAEHFGVTEDFMRMAVCLYVHGNLSTELYF